MTWIGERTEFHFEQGLDPDTGQSVDIVVETIKSAWSTTKRFGDLCTAMAEARGTTSIDELTRFLSGGFDYVKRELERQGNGELATIMENLDPEIVTERLSQAQCEADNPHSATAYVLDAALTRWGYFIGNVQFSHSPRPGIIVHRTVPIDAIELVQCLQPWLDQLPHDEAREAFRAAVEAASRLEGAKCRELCELASVSVPPIEATADTEPPKEPG